MAGVRKDLIRKKPGVRKRKRKPVRQGNPVLKRKALVRKRAWKKKPLPLPGSPSLGG